MEQEETRAVRSRDWLLMRRFQDAPRFPLEDTLFDLSDDPDERVPLDCSDNEAYEALRAAIDRYFAKTADPRFDLWNGGTVKSNSAFPALWRDAWGDDWAPQMG